MPRSVTPSLGSVVTADLVAVTGAALSPALFGDVSVVGVKGVALTAMRSGASPAENLGANDISVRKTPLRSLDDRVGFMAGQFGQFDRSILNAFNGDKNSPPLVSLLLLLAGPTAVFRRIVAVVVDAVQRVAFRARPHVSQEGVKIRLPSVTNGYSAPAVVGPLLEFWVPASAKHALPYGIKRVGIFEGHKEFLSMIRGSITTHPCQEQGGY